jgi:hypothetical protein
MPACVESDSGCLVEDDIVGARIEVAQPPRLVRIAYTLTAGTRLVLSVSSARPADPTQYPQPTGNAALQAWDTYSQSKLANLLFVLEVQRRLTDAGSTVRL